MRRNIGGRTLPCPRHVAWLGLLVAGSLLARPAPAAIRHVPAGYATIRAAAAAAANGDTVLIAPGTHTGGVFIRDKALTYASRYLLTGDTAFVSQTIVDGVSGSPCSGMSGCVGTALFEFGPNAHGSSIIGLTVRGGENGVLAAAIANISHCRVTANGDGVDYVAGSGGVIDHSVFEYNSDDGIDLNGRMNVLIHDNVIRNNNDDGIEFRLLTFSGPAVNIDMIGNTITGNGEDGIQIIDYPAVNEYVIRIDRNYFSGNFNASGLSAAIGLMANGETVENLSGAAVPERIYVTNNTFTGEKNGLVGGANLIALNNVFTGIAGKAMRRLTANSIASYSMFWNNAVHFEASVVDSAHIMVADPMLGPDGALAAGSPAIDAGTASFHWMGETVLSVPPSQVVGNAPDLGAFEFGSAPPPPNTPPAVGAGPDQTVLFPAAASLAGSVSDDGRPDPPAAIAVHWSVVSAAGPMVIHDADAVATRASFSRTGIYRLRLTATDGEVMSADTVQITVVTTPNAAPVVDAGASQTITLPSGASLDGTVTDDGLPNPPASVTTTWSQGSGPGTVTFANADAVDTQASFSAAGTYILRLTASDGALGSTDSVQVTVLPPPNTVPVVDAGPNRTITIPSGASLDGTVTDDGLPNPPGVVTTTWSKGSGPGTVTFVNANAVDTQASFSAAGSYILRLSGHDGALGTTDSMTVTVLAPPPPVDRRIAAASDDAEETATGVISTNTSDIEMVFSGSNQTVGLRFTNITVAPGAPINRAYIQFEADEAQSEATNLTLQGQAADNAATFGTASFDVSGRPRTAASVAWSPAPWAIVGEQGVNQQTTELKSVIQEIVNRPEWASGNAIAIIITGTGHRTARSFEGVPAGAALLHIEAGVSPPTNAGPVVDAGPNRSIVLPDDAVLDGTVTDDGLPDPPGALTTTWSVGSGPGPVTFGDPNQADTPVTFTVAGTYVLRLTATDGALSTTDSMQFVVEPPPNMAPFVDAGPNRTITLPASASLDGTVNDDGLPTPPAAVTTTWSKGSGPGTVTFASANAVDTQASFSMAGTYILRLTANDGDLSTTDSMTVTVSAANTAPVVDAGANQAITLPASASLDGTVADDGLPNPPGVVTTTWSKGSGPGTVTFANANAVDTQAAFSIAGTYVLRLMANDGALATTDSVQVTVLVSQPPVDRRIATSSDDAEEPAGAATSLFSTDIELVFETSLQTVGLRFTNVTVPQGATITSAWIQFEADEAQSEATNLTLQGQAADNAPSFTTTVGNISTRPRTNASAAWSPVAWSVVGEQGPNQRTPELKSVIQEIVNRPGWVSGNALAIIVTGSGHRTARSYEGLAAGAALLHIETGTGPPPNVAAVVDAGPNRSVTYPASAFLDGTVTDDGLPNPPGAVTTTWSKGSGPGTVTFANANAIDTQATFSTNGTYILRLTANDGALSTTDSMTVTVSLAPNTAPGVDAGPNQTITLPANGSLDGTVVDDGQPNPPGAVTTTWSMGSGPGTVTFANANAVDTQASFSIAGTYVLRLTANDSALGATDSVTITVLPVPNQAPVVDAGANQAITLPASAALDATVTDDGLPNPPGVVITTWSKGSGPGTVTFANANVVDTQASFSLTGTYVLRLTANDGALGATDSLTITVVNTAPVVDAGPNQSIDFGASAALDATVTDDGLPNPPGMVTTTWSKGSGPGTVSFADANAVDTQASFSAIGTYVLRLTASDGALGATDSVTVTVANTGPVVDAGANQTITLPASAALDATVTDDGQPNPPGAVTTTWSQGSGPGTVTFANANAVDTQASFSIAGMYVLRLTANDSALGATDSVTITVQPDPNVAPVVNAGVDRTIVLPASAALDATVTDDGLPAPPALAPAWSVVGGPGTVTFANANAVDTQASFTTAGIYVLRLTVSDGRLSSSDEVQITVQAVAAPIEKRTVASSDDAEESATGSMNLTSVNLDLVFNATNQTVGLRFTALAIPAGATITRAYIQFTARKVDHGAASLVIRGQAADNATTFTTSSSNVSSRPRTTATVNWSPPDWPKIGDALAEQRTPELKTVIQEIVARPGWASGNAIVIIITGTGTRTASPYDGAPAEAPLLHVEYATAGAPLMAMRAAAPPLRPVIEPPRFEFALHSVGPSPVRGDLWVEFSVADEGAASLELMDIAGRRVAAPDVRALGPGRHRLAVREKLPAGVYLVRLTQGARTRVMKVAVLR